MYFSFLFNLEIKCQQVCRDSTLSLRKLLRVSCRVAHTGQIGNHVTHRPLTSRRHARGHARHAKSATRQNHGSKPSRPSSPVVCLYWVVTYVITISVSPHLRSEVIAMMPGRWIAMTWGGAIYIFICRELQRVLFACWWKCEYMYSGKLLPCHTLKVDEYNRKRVQVWYNNSPYKSHVSYSQKFDTFE